MKIKTLIIILTFIQANHLFSQCSNVLDGITPKLSQDSFEIRIINGDSFYIFRESGIWNYARHENTPDTSLLDGTWLLLRNNNPDSIMLEVTYLNGLRHGPLICRYNNGLESEIRNYHVGKLHGKQSDYHNNGKISRERHYEHGLKNGMFCDWDYKGRITHLSHYVNNLPVGVALDFWDGVLTSEKYYEDGHLKRSVFEYYSALKSPPKSSRKKKPDREKVRFQHTIKTEEIYTDSTIIVKSYYKSGQLKSEQSYVFVEEIDCQKIYHKTGQHRFWNEKGELQKLLVYKQDQLITTIEY